MIKSSVKELSPPPTANDKMSEDQLTVKNRGRKKSESKIDLLTGKMYRTSLAVDRLKLNSGRWSDENRKIEAGAGYLFAVINKMLKRRKKLAMQSIRDFIFQRVKVLAFLSLNMDLVREKRRKNFHTFVDAVRNNKKLETVESFEYSFNSESGKTPKFQLSKDQLSKINQKLSMEEGLYIIGDLFALKHKVKAFCYLKNSKSRWYKRHIQPSGGCSLNNSQTQKSPRNNQAPRRRPVTPERARLLFNLIRLISRSRLSKYFHAFQFKLSGNQISSNHQVKNGHALKNQIDFQSRINGLNSFMKIAALKDLKTAFDEMTNFPAIVFNQSAKVIYGKVKEIKRSATPFKGFDHVGEMDIRYSRQRSKKISADMKLTRRSQASTHLPES